MSLSAMPAGSGSSMSWCGERRCGLLPREWLEFVGLRRVSFECGRSRWASADSGDAGLAWLAITAPHPLRMCTCAGGCLRPDSCGAVARRSCRSGRLFNEDGQQQEKAQLSGGS
eukprot:scaffold125263_cov63-Phaeocystis_antarctica.AAC.2